MIILSRLLILETEERPLVNDCFSLFGGEGAMVISDVESFDFVETERVPIETVLAFDFAIDSPSVKGEQEVLGGRFSIDCTYG